MDRVPRGGGIFGVFAVQAQAAGLGDGDAVRLGALLDGGGLQFKAAPGGTVGLGEHQRHGVAGCEQLVERYFCKLWRACKNNFHVFCYKCSSCLRNIFAG